MSPVVCAGLYSGYVASDSLVAEGYRDRQREFDRCEPTAGIAPWTRSRAGAVRQSGARVPRRPHPDPRVLAQPGIELYFSVVQCEVIEPDDFASLEALAYAPTAFGEPYSAIATPFGWLFTRPNLHRVLAALPGPSPAPAA